MGPLYASVLEQAQARRDKRFVNRTNYRQQRFERFMRTLCRPRWQRQGHRVTWA
jgi:hypothetical protein